MILLTLLSCALHESPTRAAALPDLPASALVGRAIGGDRWGFVDFVSATGRTVVLYRFPAAHESAGPPPEFQGYHGEEAINARPAIVDTVTGAEREAEEIVAVSADLRFLVALADGGAWLIDGDTGAWRHLDEGGPAVDMTQDHNRCLSARTASFDGLGRHVAYLADDAVVVRELPDGAPRSYPVQGRVWRAWPRSAGDGALALLVVPQTEGATEGQSPFPVQNTSCYCQQCRRFSLSYGFYGWAGPDFSFATVGPSGQLAFEDTTTPYGDQGWVVGGKLYDGKGAPIALPEGCAVAATWSGQEVLGLACADHAALWTPGEPARPIDVAPQALSRLPEVRVGGQWRLITPAATDKGPLRLLDPRTGAFVDGPIGTGLGEASPDGVVLVQQEGGVLAWDTVHGTTWTIPLPTDAKPRELGPRSAYLGDGGVVMVIGEQAWPLERVASGLTATGCALQAAEIGPRGVQRGPWTWICPAEPAPG